MDAILHAPEPDRPRQAAMLAEVVGAAVFSGSSAEGLTERPLDIRTGAQP